MQDLRGHSKPFGNTLILLAGDLRQTLPVIPRSTPADEMRDEINACLKNSNSWVHRKDIKVNYISVRLQNDRSDEIFSDQLLAIENGTHPVESISGRTQLPPKVCNLVS